MSRGLACFRGELGPGLPRAFKDLVVYVKNHSPLMQDIKRVWNNGKNVLKMFLLKTTKQSLSTVCSYIFMSLRLGVVWVKEMVQTEFRQARVCRS